MIDSSIIAKTIKELRDALTKIIEAHGGDLEWNGFDDESIYIYSNKTGCNHQFEISPRNI